MDFPQQLQACVEQANEALRRFIAPQPFQNTPLVEAMQYGALLGGKRLRPFLVYATGDMFGVSRATLDAPAAAVECIHAYSLMHDDLPAMDDDDLRRGQPTCHIKFGEANAILAGDALQTLAFSILSDAPMPEVPDRDRLAMISELAQASGARLLHTSTSEVYGDPEVHPQPETYWGNVNPVGPRGVYGEAKRYGHRHDDR